MTLRTRPRLVITATDAAKLAEIWKNHALPLRSMLLAFCANPEDADDALQELFLKLGRNLSVLENAKSHRAFLAVSARRIAIDIARKRSTDQRHAESPEAAEMLHPAPSLPVPGDDLAAKIREALESLPVDQRRVAEAKLLEGKTLAAIAQGEGVSLNTAASRLRYSLDKMRAQLRPLYKAMKNQPNSSKQTQDSTERLIRPLEPKRVPSVVPGLEGAAALAVDDSDGSADFSGEIPTAECWVTPEPIVIVCEPMVPPAGEGPEITDLPSESEICVFPPPENLDDSADSTDDDTEESGLNPDEVIEAIFEGENSGADDTEGQNIDLGDFVDCVILPPEILEENVDGDVDTGLELPDPNALLGEYNNFLSENPDWFEAHSGGEIQLQVITASKYFNEIELANPGEACAFDLWFENTYLAKQSGEQEEGESHHYDSEDAGVPQPWLRGGMANVSGDCQVMNLGGTHQTVVTGGELVMDQPVEGSFAVQEGGRISIGDQSLGDGSYEISAEGIVSSEVETSPVSNAMEKTHSESEVHPPATSEAASQKSINFSVTPIVSGSDTVLESHTSERTSFNAQRSMDSTPIDLPTLVETQKGSLSEEQIDSGDIAFTDDAPVQHDSHSEPAAEPISAESVPQQNITAAVGGAFVAGSATQVAPSTRGASTRKGLIG